MNRAVRLAYASVFLYLALALTCLYFALTFVDFKTRELRGGRYATPKFVFFVVLFLSAVLDIPLFIGCIVQEGPHDCEWNSSSYVVFWLFHLISTCGYTYAIITPPILWSDIIQQKDGNLWNSAYPADSTKWFFRIAYVAFCVTTFVTVLGAVVYQDPNHQADYTKSNPVGAIAQVLTPLVTTTVTVGCLWSGITLQRHVVSVGLRGSTQFKILAQLNITMLIIVVTYVMRSLLVLCLYEPMSESYVTAFQPLRSSFFLWLLWTRWLPCVFCSFCLVHEMRFKGSGSHGPSSQNGDQGDLRQGLLRKGERTSSLRNSNPRTLSAESGRSQDSALEETYSMLSSVDFPDSASDTSSYVLSPISSPDRDNNNASGRQGSVDGIAQHGDVERGDRNGRRRMLRKHLVSSSGSAGPYVAPSSMAASGVSGVVSRPAGRGSRGHGVLESPSSGSDTDFAYGMRSPSRTSVDHFFTFAAPGLNVSHIAAAEGAAEGSRSASIPIPQPPANSIQSTVQQGGSRGVMSFSPPTWRGPAAAASTPDFINEDERVSPEVTTKTL
jgi:hypothetical protein